MKITVKGQVTIPKSVRDKLELDALCEVEFVEEKGRIYLVKRAPQLDGQRFARLRGRATARMSTEEIMQLTRGEG